MRIVVIVIDICMCCYLTITIDNYNVSGFAFQNMSHFSLFNSLIWKMFEFNQLVQITVLTDTKLLSWYIQFHILLILFTETLTEQLTEQFIIWMDAFSEVRQWNLSLAHILYLMSIIIISNNKLVRQGTPLSLSRLCYASTWLHQMIPVSCHFQSCKVPQGMSFFV